MSTFIEIYKNNNMKKNYFIGILITASTLSFAQNIPVDFETSGYGASWTWTVFENSTNPSLQIVANPDPTGLNTSSTVARFIALQAGNPWAGCETMHGSDIGSFSIDTSNSIIRIMVWKTKISDVGIKLVTSSAASLGEIKVANTLINQWEQLTFDFSAHIGGLAYDQLVVFPDFVARSANDTMYFDNVFGDAAYLGDDEISRNTTTVFPNPTNGIVTVNSDSRIDLIALYSIEGKLLVQAKNSTTLDMTSFKSGVYILRSIENGIPTNHRILKN